MKTEDLVALVADRAVETSARGLVLALLAGGVLSLGLLAGLGFGRISSPRWAPALRLKLVLVLWQPCWRGCARARPAVRPRIPPGDCCVGRPRGGLMPSSSWSCHRRLDNMAWSAAIR